MGTVVVPYTEALSATLLTLIVGGLLHRSISQMPWTMLTIGIAAGIYYLVSIGWSPDAWMLNGLAIGGLCFVAWGVYDITVDGRDRRFK